MMALRAEDPGEALPEITALQVIADHLRDYRAEETIVFFIPLLVGLLKILAMFVQQIPQR